MERSKRSLRRAFTLIELMVVILVILLVSALVLPQVLPAIAHREVSEGGRLLQAALVQARAEAVGANAPRGFRLLIDPTYANRPEILAYNRWVPITPGPDYSNGMVTVWPVPITALVFTQIPPYPIANPDGSTSPYPYYPANVPATPSNPGFNSPNNPCFGQVLMVEQAPFVGNDTRQSENNPTSWFWNVRIGDRVTLGGRPYTVVGPMTRQNPELFVNDGDPGTQTALTRFYSDPNGANQQPRNVEYLFLVNGKDDAGEGFIDQGFDGLDNGRTLPNGQIVGLEGTIDNVLEWQDENWFSELSALNAPNDALYLSGNPIVTPSEIHQPMPYTIKRRPIVAAGARETSLPRGVVIDATTWDTTRERSRLPIDPLTRSVDVMLTPSGQAVVQTVYSSPSSIREGAAFFHFWIAERAEVLEPVANLQVAYQLPMPVGVANFPNASDQTSRTLGGERMMITLFGRTGNVSANSAESFDGGDVNRPFYEVRLGSREAR